MPSTEAIRQERRNKKCQIGKKEAKLSLLVGDMILYIENTKDSTKITVRNNKQIQKSQGTKLTLKNLVLLYTNNKLAESEIRKTITLTIPSKNKSNQNKN